MDLEPIYHLSDSIALALKMEKLQSWVVCGQDGNEYLEHHKAVELGEKRNRGEQPTQPHISYVNSLSCLSFVCKHLTLMCTPKLCEQG